jgi:hypothetical protein
MRENETSDSDDDMVRKTLKKQEKKPMRQVNLDKLKPILGNNEATQEELMDLLFHCPY